MEKISKKIVYLAGIVFFVMLNITTGQAATWCENATVTQTGANPYANQISAAASEYVIYLTCEDASIGWATERRFVILENTFKDSNYATALTAAVSGNPVRVLLMGTSENSLIEILYLRKL